MHARLLSSDQLNWQSSDDAWSGHDREGLSSLTAALEPGVTPVEPGGALVASREALVKNAVMASKYNLKRVSAEAKGGFRMFDVAAILSKQNQVLHHPSVKKSEN